MILKIISGGQAGVDRAALDFSIQHQINCGGWCPKNRWAEDGKIDLKYPLTENQEMEPIYRTIKNIEISDGTLLLHKGSMDSGSIQTLKHARNTKSPILCIDISKRCSPDKIRNWMQKNEIRTLNIAGPRESNCPGIYKLTLDFLARIKFLF